MALWIRDLQVPTPTQNNQIASKGYTDSKLTQTIKKTSDQSVTSSTTLVNDSDLTFSALANTKYYIEVWLNITKTSSFVVPFKAAWSTPSGSAFHWGNYVGLVANGLVIAGFPTDFNETQIGAASIQTTFVIQGSLAFTTGGSSGNVTLQWAQVTSNATPTTVKANSLLKYRIFT